MDSAACWKGSVPRCGIELGRFRRNLMRSRGARGGRGHSKVNLEKAVLSADDADDADSEGDGTSALLTLGGDRPGVGSNVTNSLPICAIWENLRIAEMRFSG